MIKNCFTPFSFWKSLSSLINCIYYLKKKNKNEFGTKQWKKSHISLMSSVEIVFRFIWIMVLLGLSKHFHAYLLKTIDFFFKNKTIQQILNGCSASRLSSLSAPISKVLKIAISSISMMKLWKPIRNSRKMIYKKKLSFIPFRAASCLRLCYYSTSTILKEYLLLVPGIQMKQKTQLVINKRALPNG